MQRYVHTGQGLVNIGKLGRLGKNALGSIANYVNSASGKEIRNAVNSAIDAGTKVTEKGADDIVKAIGDRLNSLKLKGGSGVRVRRFK